MSNSSSEFFKREEISVLDTKLKQLYISIGIPLDLLAYTDEFESIFETVSKLDDTLTRAAVFRRLIGMRKRGMLPRLTSSAIESVQEVGDSPDSTE